MEKLTLKTMKNSQVSKTDPFEDYRPNAHIF